MNKIKHIISRISPPLLMDIAHAMKPVFFPVKKNPTQLSSSVADQDLSVYWNDEMAKVLESWGEMNVWKELPLLMVNCRGRVLDIACGTGKAMSIIGRLPLEVDGCDISDMLIGKALERGITQDRLTVCDATDMPYANNTYDFAYSIGSLEHFTEKGIQQLLAECNRVVSRTSFHMIPVSKSGMNEGWLKNNQSFHNNSVTWWLERFQSVYETVFVLDSTWDDQISVGKWFVCMKSEEA